MELSTEIIDEMPHIHHLEERNVSNGHDYLPILQFDN